MAKKQQLRILCPNGHLGFAPTKEESFFIGAATRPDYYCCDSGSDDIGPAPLGADKSVGMYEWQKHDLELMLVKAREQGVPMIIGSAGDTGSNSRVDLYVQIIKDLAKEHRLPKFKLAYFYSEVDKAYIKKKMEAGVVIEGLDGRSPLTLEDLEKTDRIVAVAGVHPYPGAGDGGRCHHRPFQRLRCVCAPSSGKGFPEDLAYLGKVLECASFCANPTEPRKRSSAPSPTRTSK